MIFLPAIVVAMYAMFGAPPPAQVKSGRNTDKEELMEDSDVIDTQLCPEKEQKHSGFFLNVFSRVPLLQFGKAKRLTSTDCQTDDYEIIEPQNFYTESPEDKKQKKYKPRTRDTMRKDTKKTASSPRVAKRNYKSPLTKSKSLQQIDKTKPEKNSHKEAAPDSPRGRLNTGTKSAVSSSALERSRLAYEKKIRQLSGKCQGFPKETQKFSAVCKKGFSTPQKHAPRRQLEGDLSSASPPRSPGFSKQKPTRNSSKSSDYEFYIEAESDTVQEESRGLIRQRWESIGKFLTRSFSSSSSFDTGEVSPASPVSAKQLKPKCSPRTPTKKPQMSPWRPSGVSRSHSLEDTPVTPVSHLKKTQSYLGSKLKRSGKALGRVKGSTNLLSGEDTNDSHGDPQLNKSLATSTLCHIGYYYFLSFVVFVCMQMYEAHFGGNMLQFLSRS